MLTQIFFFLRIWLHKYIVHTYIQTSLHTIEITSFSRNKIISDKRGIFRIPGLTKAL